VPESVRGEGGPDADQRVSPLAQQLALELGLDLADLAQRFPHKRLQREHVVEAVRDMLAEASRTRTAQPPVRSTPAGPGLLSRREARRETMTNMRRLIANRMGESSRITAPVTLTTEVDATELVRLRDALRPEDGNRPKPSYNVLLAKLVACALREHPELNASLEGGEVVYWEPVNVGIAVDTPRGLIVPVLFDVAAKSLDALGTEAEDLLSRAQSGKALPAELTGGTFTITNLGGYRIDAFTPIINAPECAILGVGRLQSRPVVDRDGAVVVRTLMYLSLTFDHRLVDGAPAARFLKRVAEYVEQPYLWLARL
jgi:pyruvate dehydrogenase E2 component (dihydrolipoamide acetyltransferase)